MISLVISSLALLACTEASQSILAIPSKPGLCNTYEKNALLNTAHIDGFYNPESCHKALPKVAAKPKPTPKKRIKWTSKPACLKDAKQREYCVYTHSEFASGRGISFFTSPQVASKVLTYPAFTDPSIHETANKFSNPPWEVRHIPGRGNGLFATRKLERGDLIIANTPLGVYNVDAFPTDYEMGYKYLRKTFDQLPAASKEIFVRLGTHAQGDLVMERINTNSFAGEFEGEKHFLVYPETAVMNHDCRPNAMFYHNTTTLIHSTHAARTIMPGEEITITYIYLLQNRKDRHEELEMMWGFKCTCDHCNKGDVARRASDRNMKKIEKLQSDLAALSDWTWMSPATPQMAEKLLKLYAEEHLYAALGTGHMYAALAYNAVGNVKKAVEHAEKAFKAGMVTAGVSDDEVQMRSLLKDPEAHWSYKKREDDPALKIKS